MNLEQIFKDKKVNIEELNTNLDDDLGREICEDWDTLKVYGLNNWKYFIRELRLSNKDSQLLLRWVCDQYKYFLNLDERDQNLIQDKIIGILKKEDNDRLNQIIKSSPSLPIDIVVQFSDNKKFRMDDQVDVTKNIILTYLDTVKSIQRVNFKDECCFNLLQLSSDTDCLITFPTLNILLPTDIKLYKVGEDLVSYTGDGQIVQINTSFLYSINDSNLIDRFCEEPSKEIFDLFSKEVKIMWYLWSDYCLKNDKGNLELASNILSYRR